MSFVKNRSPRREIQKTTKDRVDFTVVRVSEGTFVDYQRWRVGTERGGREGSPVGSLNV